ncbi:MAG: leucine-rich repeat protein [Tannerella sp.]|jgi:hypothetical protein|nr:leucine-rich repeat protein [Tannerella sp.]
MKHHFISIILFLAGTGLGLQAQEKIIHVEAPGTVATLLTAEEKANTVKLTVTTAAGIIPEAADYDVINAMPKLKELDLSGDANTINLPTVFQNNATIESIKFPSKIQTWGGGSFNNCALKGVVSFPASVTNMAVFQGRLDNCQGITAFAFPDNPPAHNIQALDGVVTSKESWALCLMKYPCGKTGDEYTIPEGVTFVAQQAFGDNHKLKKLTFASTVNQFQTETAIIRNTDAIEEFDVTPGGSFLGAVDGILYKQATKALFLYPPARKSETLTVDGSVIEVVPNAFFADNRTLKRVVFTEGFREIDGLAFKAASFMEYVVLPASTDTIGNEAFHGLGYNSSTHVSSLQYIICKATTPPRLGTVVFREANGTDVRVGVPEEAVSAYRASKWVNTVDAAPQGYAASQIVAFRNIAYQGAVPGLQDICVPGFQLKITAGEPPAAGQAFAGWTSEPAGVEFSNAAGATSFFTMPDYDVTIIATFSAQSPYTIVGATTSQSGSAAVGSSVDLITDLSKIVGGTTLIFREWRVNRGNVTILNPGNRVASFIMVDDDIEIEAVYQAAYMVSVHNGSAPELEYFAGDEVTVTAGNQAGKQFSEWTTITPGVVFANPKASPTTFIMPESEVDVTAVFTVVGAGIDAVDAAALKFIYRPGDDAIRIEGLDAGSDFEYAVYRIIGDVVRRDRHPGSRIERIPVAGLKPGAYLLAVRNTFFHRFIVK